MGKKRKTTKRNPAGPIRSTGPLAAGLRERARLRRTQKSVFDELSPLDKAFDELLMKFDTLAHSAELDPELVHLLREAQRWVVDGVDHILSANDPHAVDEARLLLELEFLFRDFAAAPAHVEEWAHVEDWRRQDKFGFGKLRQREERRQDLDAEMVVAQRDYWISHSTDSHPKSLKDEMPAARHFSFSLLSSMGDLLQHASSALDAAVGCVVASGASIPPDFDNIGSIALEECFDRIHRTLNSEIPIDDFEKLSQPRPKKQTGKKFWHNSQDA